MTDGPDPHDHLADVVETLLERLREADAEEVVERLTRRDPALLDRLMTGLVLVGESLTLALTDEPPTAPEPPRQRQRIAVRDDDAVAAGDEGRLSS